MSAGAREEVLARVRAAIVHAAPPAAVPRGYRRRSDDGVDTFVERLAHYDAEARRVTDAELDECIRACLRARGLRRVVAPDGIPDVWLTEVEPLRDSPPLSAEALDDADGTVSTCALAVAETGTIVLDASAGMGRRILSLIPDYLLCVVRADQIVGSVPEAIARLDAARPLTFISGPSATVDIEMVRVRGVHGPRTLDVVIVG